MKINLSSPNQALISIFENPNQLVTLDANVFIPPNRRQSKHSFEFKQFCKIWIDPIFNSFPNLAIHESVYDEIVVKESINSYIDIKINDVPQRLVIHKDSTLTPEEKMLRDSIEEKIYPYTKYEPLLDNKDDRGEVKSLSHIAVKGLLYFAVHDSNAIQLIEKAEEWNTGLDNVSAIKMYELIYYLYFKQKCDNNSLRMLYKYQYYLTEREKETNPEWGKFIASINLLYNKNDTP